MLENKIVSWIPIIIIELFLGFTAILIPSYVFVILGIAVFVLLIFIWPELSYYLFILMLGNQLVSLIIHGIFLPDLLSHLFVLIIIAFWIFARMSNIRPVGPGSPLTLPMTLFFIWAFISLLWAEVLNDAIISLTFLFFGYLMFYFSITIIRTKRTFNTVIWLIIFLGVVNSIVVFYSLYGPFREERIIKEIFRYGDALVWFHFKSSTALGRGSGLAHPQTTAFFLNIPIMFAIGIFLTEQNIGRKMIISIITVFMISGLLATLSKAGVLGLIGGLTLFVLYIKPLRQRFFLSIVVVSISIVSLFILSRLGDFSETFTKGVAGTIGGGGGYSSLEGRLSIWNKGFEDLLVTYGLGRGSGNFYYMFDPITRYHAHSIIFSVLFSLGFIGLWIWIWLWIKAFSSAVSVLKKSYEPYYKNMLLSVMAGWISILIFGLFEIYYEYSAIWTLLGIGLALVNISNRDRLTSHEVRYMHA